MEMFSGFFLSPAIVINFSWASFHSHPCNSNFTAHCYSTRVRKWHFPGLDAPFSPQMKLLNLNFLSSSSIIFLFNLCWMIFIPGLLWHFSVSCTSRSWCPGMWVLKPGREKFQGFLSFCELWKPGARPGVPQPEVEGNSCVNICVNNI